MSSRMNDTHYRRCAKMTLNRMSVCFVAAQIQRMEQSMDGLANGDTCDD